MDFKKHAAGFNLLIRLKTGKEYVFQNIQINEFDNLFGYIRQKGLRIMNIVEALMNVAAGDEDSNQIVLMKRLIMELKFLVEL